MNFSTIELKNNVDMGGEKAVMVLSFQWKMITANVKEQTIVWSQDSRQNFPESQNSKIANSKNLMLLSFWFCKSRNQVPAI